MKPAIAVVIGDPSGIAPEVCVKALATREPQARADFVLIGSIDAVRDAAEAAGLDLRFEPCREMPGERDERDVITVVDDGMLAKGDYTLGTASAAAGRAVDRWMHTGLELAARRAVAGLIIAPVDMTSFELAGINVDAIFEPRDVFILRSTGRLRTVPIAEHVMIRDVPAMIKTVTIANVIAIVDEQLRTWGFPSPKIAVAGLNPHAAGEEDVREIAPAVLAARSKGFDAAGPLSPDTVFRRGLLGEFDVVITMYHDQGQIAVKTIGLEDACAVYIGLPYVRVGIPHGSALEIAGRNRAQHATALHCMNTAARLVSGGNL